MHLCFAFQRGRCSAYDDSWYAETSLRCWTTGPAAEWPGPIARSWARWGDQGPADHPAAPPLLLLFGGMTSCFCCQFPLLRGRFVLPGVAGPAAGIRRGIPLLVLVFSAMPLTVDMSRRFYVEMPDYRAGDDVHLSCDPLGGPDAGGAFAGGRSGAGAGRAVKGDVSALRRRCGAAADV